MNDNLYLGLDIGSISINTVLVDKEKNIVEERYDYCHGKPFNVLRDILTEITDRYGRECICNVSLTGTGGKLASQLIGGHFVNEIVAQATSVAELYPEAKSVIEMGGEDSKLIFMDRKEGHTHSQLSDFAMNTLCAAGTGSFLDQQANRIGVSIENEFGELALKSENPPRIAGRCSVFAKSDMIHLQQIATPVHDIVAGLCFAVARNFKSNLAKGKGLEKPVLFQGGVAANAGVVRAFTEILDLEDGELIIPERFKSMGAIGGVYYLMGQEDMKEATLKELDELDEYLKRETSSHRSLEPLKKTDAEYWKKVVFNSKGEDKLGVYLGVDVGSLSTNVVLIDDDNNVVARRYLPTASKPIEAVQKGLAEVGAEVGDNVYVKAVGSTGSGRYLVGDFVGADAIRNEITAQATAAIAHDPTVDTIFEIGGQDSKYISIRDGVVVDFEMNKVCAAGTGSFLEEQAEKLDINIKEEFSDIAFQGTKPAQLGCRCTVFMESDLNSHQQRGTPKSDLIGGLAYSIVNNYLQKLVGDKYVGDKIFFQGGVTNNKSVVAAFESVLGKPIIVPPHYDVTGAIGAAILARDSMAEGAKTRFRGFDVSNVKFALDKVVCKSCSNVCEIRRVRIDGVRKPLYYGGRCEKYEVKERKSKGKGVRNLFHERHKLLLGSYDEIKEKNGKIKISYAPEPKDDRITIGIPEGLTIFYQQFPFWRTFFNELNFRIKTSGNTDHPLITKSLELLTAETCFPVEVMHGHVATLVEDEEVDYVWSPFVVNEKTPDANPTNNCNCPWVQTYPFMTKGAIGEETVGDKMLIPTLHFRYFDRVLNKELSGFMKEQFGIPVSKTKKAIKLADEAQINFEKQVEELGQEVLENIPEDKKAMVIMGRPYNSNDPLLNLQLVDKLIKLDILPIPLDFLPLRQEYIFEDYSSMYWPNGRKILSGARIIAKNPLLHAVYMGNFRCGPDSFLAHYVREEMKGKPYLQLEIDEHSADAGMITRCEAFLDSLSGYKKVGSRKEKIFTPGDMTPVPYEDRTLYLPYMNDNALAVAATLRYCGFKSEVLPRQTEEDIELGRQYTSSRECFPMICTTGSFVKKLKEPGLDPNKVSFFMPDHNGPCRFGQYNRFQRIIFDRLGFEGAKIVSPSNENSYEDIAPGRKNFKFNYTVWKALVAVGVLRKMLQERRPYEIQKGQTNAVYQECLNEVIANVEIGMKGINKLLKKCTDKFNAIPITNGKRKPVIAVVGEIFMRDNEFCNGGIVTKLEELGAETFMAPFSEWITYSTYRLERDSRWKGNRKGLIRAKIKAFASDIAAKRIHKAVGDHVELDKEIHLDKVLDLCGPYIHKDYDGDPALAFGLAAGLMDHQVSGVVNILPFTCMPGTLIQSVSHIFRKNYDKIPWENIAYDGQEDTNMETRLQAFMHQAREYAQQKGHDKPREWSHDAIIEEVEMS